MNARVLVGFLGSVLAATAVYYVQSHRNAKAEAVPVVPAAPVAAPTPIPAPTIPAVKPVPVQKKSIPKTVAVVEKPEEQALVEQAKVEAPPAPDPAPVPARIPAPVVAPEPTLPSPPRPPEPQPEPPQPRSVTIASGTLVTVRLGETISTGRTRLGDSFFATLDQPLVIEGLVIAEKGARATGRVVDAVEAGRVKGLAHLALELTSLMSSDGQKIELQTARFEKEGPSSKSEDAGKVGIGAAIGAAIGAIAGGGTGAAIGAATGGAAGGGVVAATRWKARGAARGNQDQLPGGPAGYHNRTALSLGRAGFAAI